MANAREARRNAHARRLSCGFGITKRRIRGRVKGKQLHGSDLQSVFGEGRAENSRKK